MKNNNNNSNMKKIVVEDKKGIKVYIEIPKGSKIKYEYDRKSKEIKVDRILRKKFHYPANYGFVREALDWDGDELDVLIYSEEIFIPGSLLNARIVGAMQMIDSGETDTKIIAVHSDDYRLNKINNINQIPKKWLIKIENFFLNYKNWKGKGIVSIEGFKDKKYAINEYNECVELMKIYGKLSKKSFISKMKLAKPEKYIINKN